MSDTKSTKPPVIVPTVLASLVGIGGAIAGGTQVLVPRTDDEMAFAVEDLASNLSGEVPDLSEEGFEDVTETGWERAVELAANECILLLMAASESDFYLSLDHVPREAHSDNIQALAYRSADDAETVTYRATFNRSPGRVLVQERRTAASEEVNMLSIAANWLDAGFLARRLPGELRRRAAAARSAGTGDEPIVFEVTISEVHGTLVHPLDEAMLQAIDETVWLGIADRDAAEYRLQDAQGSQRGSQLASVNIDGTRRSIVAAIDARTFEHCISLEVWPLQGSWSSMGVFRYPSGYHDPLTQNIVELCPVDGVTLIYGSQMDSAVVLRRLAPAERVDRLPESMRMTASVRERIETCRSGDAASCREAALAYREGSGVDQDPDEAIIYEGHACTLDASKCYAYALTQEGPRGHELLVRACREGRVGIACAVLGDRFRLGLSAPENYALAHAAYARACAIGGHCRAQENLLELELVTPEESEEAREQLGFEALN